MHEQLINSVKQQLQGITDPFTSDKLTAAKGLKSVDVNDSSVTVTLVKGYPIEPAITVIKELVDLSLIHI